eukprot:6882814-Ditylum_brightwellii.AAC.1
MEDGEIRSITQKEGVAQGCPGSTVLSALTLCEIISEVKDELRKWRASMPPISSIDNGYSKFITFVDDKNILVALQDVLWVFQIVECVGKKYGLFPKKSKNKVVTNILGISILPHIQNKRIHDELEQAIRDYTDNGEESNGLVVLGMPIGSYDYIAKFLLKFTTTLHEDSLAISNEIENIQTLGQIYSSCLLACASFRMLLDVATNVSLNVDYTMQQWSLDTLHAIKRTTKTLLCNILQTSSLPSHAYALATLPKSLNGLGFFDLTRYAINCFVVPMAKAI